MSVLNVIQGIVQGSSGLSKGVSYDFMNHISQAGPSGSEFRQFGNL
jgi:hypothetical protein